MLQLSPAYTEFKEAEPGGTVCVTQIIFQGFVYGFWQATNAAKQTAESGSIVNSTWAYPEVTINYGIVYDQMTGLILETSYENNQTQPTPRYIKSGSSIIETNISGTVIPEFTPVPAGATVALITGFLTMLRRRKSS